MERRRPLPGRDRARLHGRRLGGLVRLLSPFILHYAEMAERTGCELFCVGCELGTTAVHAVEWREIVAAVRGVYSGPLTYADNQVETILDAVTWWDAVDYIGQDAYPTLTPVAEPTVEDLLGGWTSFRARLQQLSERWDKPLDPDRDRLPQRRRRRPESLGLAETGGRRPGCPGRFSEAACRAVEGRSGSAALLVAMVARSGRRRRRRHRLYAARQAGRGRPPLVVRPARMSRSGRDFSFSTSPRG